MAGDSPALDRAAELLELDAAATATWGLQLWAAGGERCFVGGDTLTFVRGGVATLQVVIVGVDVASVV